ncbi:MAG: hypothetical protein LBT65_03035 [Synergistaceae bacterium]|jgi:TolA-binding protein|nr:hypothetical protein [Synergistaceae bacterium]
MIFLIICFLAIRVTGAYAAVSGEEMTRQENLALEYRLRITRTPADEAETRERLYLGIIEECPDTDAAQEALWVLAGIYLDDFDEPQEVKAQEVLEYFIKNYPDSPWLPHVENRLLWLYEADGQGNDGQARALVLFERILQREMPLSIRLSLELRCARSYERAKQLDKAREWYARIVKEAGSAPSPEAEAAKSRLAALKKK